MTVVQTVTVHRISHQIGPEEVKGQGRSMWLMCTGIVWYVLVLYGMSSFLSWRKFVSCTPYVVSYTVQYSTVQYVLVIIRFGTGISPSGLHSLVIYFCSSFRAGPYRGYNLLSSPASLRLASFHSSRSRGRDSDPHCPVRHTHHSALQWQIAA